MKLTFVVSSLGMGGAERVVQLLSRGLVARRHEVSVVTTANRPQFYTLEEGIQTHEVNLPGRAPDRAPPALPRWKALLRMPGGLARLRSAILATRPDLVISIGDQVNVSTLLALFASATPVVATEHTDPAVRPLWVGWRLLRRLAYRRITALVSVSRGVDSGFSWVPSERRRVINNPVDAAPSHPADPEADPPLGSGRWVAAMGRLHREKGFDLLLEAFGGIADKHGDWNLVIVGDGIEREALKKKADQLSGRVWMAGPQRDPFPILKSADLFVLPSRVEGFGNVIVEAMHCGLPVVSFDCPSGPSEIIVHGENGLLVPPEDVAGLASAMSRLMGDGESRARMAVAARENARRFALARIIDQWEEQVLSLALTGRTGDESTPPR